MSAAGPVDPPAIDGRDGIEPGKRLIRVAGDQGLSLAERLANRLHKLAWRTPLHALRLRGRYPLKLLGVPIDEALTMTKDLDEYMYRVATEITI